MRKITFPPALTVGAIHESTVPLAVIFSFSRETTGLPYGDVTRKNCRGGVSPPVLLPSHPSPTGSADAPSPLSAWQTFPHFCGESSKGRAFYLYSREASAFFVSLPPWGAMLQATVEFCKQNVEGTVVKVRIAKYELCGFEVIAVCAV